jgi:carbonic anhydrase/acetyltransferase-like protein (isoleucine patch superfamily)
MILNFKGKEPRFHPSAWVAPGAVVIGDVEVAEDASIWYNAVVRGDINSVRIGRRTNLQDLCVVHPAVSPVLIGDEVTVGHRAILHACTIGHRCLIGMGSIVMDGVSIGDDCMVAAGAIVTPGTVVPARTMVMGTPARPRKELTDQELEGIKLGLEEYLQLTKAHAAIANENPGSKK